MKTIVNALISTGFALSLAACGGGGGGCKLSLGGLSCKSDSTPNVAPVASAGPVQSVSVNDEVTLNGTGSQDANLDTLTYAWEMTSKPAGSAAVLSSTTAPKPVFTADKAGDYTFSLKVSDGQASSTSTTTVTATAANLVPVANAGAFQNVLVDRTVTLDASKSTDGNNDLLSYAWTLTPPSGSGARLDNASYPRPQFTPDVAGTYIASLFVSDGKSTSAMAVTRIEASSENLAPVAKTGADQSVTLGARVVVDGSTSFDPNADLLTYQWKFVYKPPTSALKNVDSPSAAITTFTPDVVGDYVLGLSVSDPKGSSSTVNTTVNVALGNQPPEAKVKQDTIEGRPGQVIPLDGSPSSDPNGDLITAYQWSVVAAPIGSSIKSIPQLAQTSFTPDLIGPYVFSLRVTDGQLSSAAVNVVVNVSNLNLAPVAVAGSDQAAIVDQPIMLDGSTSFDPNGDTLTDYTWTVVSAPTGSSTNTSSLVNSKMARAYVKPDKEGIYVFGLTVKDDKLTSPISYTRITASAANTAPTPRANVLPAPNVLTGTLVTLDGTASRDAQNDRLTYKWSVISAPGAAVPSLSDDTSPKPTFTASASGPYVFGLTVSDGKLSSTELNVTVIASTLNMAPTAVTGADQNTTINQSVVLNGTASSDPNNDLLTYRWSVVSFPLGSSVLTANRLVGSSTPLPSFTPDVEGIYVFGLVVNDGKVDSPMAYARVTASAANAAPVALPRAPSGVTSGSLVTLDGTASSDANKDPLTYTWSVLSWPGQSAPTLTLTNPKQPTFVASALGDYVFGLTVNDGKVSSTLETVSVRVSTTNVAPVAFAGPDRSVATGSTVILDGTGSTDANGNRLTYTWNVRSAPTGSRVNTVFPEAGAGGKASFVADKAGNYVVSLVVNDGQLSSNMSVVTITAGPVDLTAPIADAGDNVTATVGSSVALNGLGSRDPSGAVLTYFWSLEPNGSGAIPNASARMYSTSAPSPAFVADVAGVYVISLRVSNGTRTSEKSFVTITVN